LAFLRRGGYVGGVVERWIPGANVRKDFLGCIDIIVVRQDETLAVQATTIGNMAHRIAKAQGQPGLLKWLEGGTRLFQVHGWYKRGRRWETKITELRPDDLSPVVVQGPRRRGRKPVQAELF
jgi:hypothetical protein